MVLVDWDDQTASNTPIMRRPTGISLHLAARDLSSLWIYSNEKKRIKKKASNKRREGEGEGDRDSIAAHYELELNKLFQFRGRQGERFFFEEV